MKGSERERGGKEKERAACYHRRAARIKCIAPGRSERESRGFPGVPLRSCGVNAGRDTRVKHVFGNDVSEIIIGFRGRARPGPILRDANCRQSADTRALSLP